MSDLLKRCSLGIACARRVVGSQGPNDPAWEDSDPPSMAACLLLCAAEVERLTAECVTARTVYVVLDRDWGETPAMISIHTTLAGGEAAAAKYNRKTGDHFDIEERTVDGEEAGDE